jgi:transposase
MWGALGVRRVLAYGQPMDLRKSITGLVGVVKSLLEEDPLSGSVFVFLNRRGTYLKCVFWDRTGWCLVAKRLEHGHFRLPTESRKQELSTQVFELLLDGIELGRRHRV